MRRVSRPWSSSRCSAAPRAPTSTARARRRRRCRSPSRTSQRFGVRLATAGPGEVDIGVELPGEVRPNADRIAHIAPRFPGHRARGAQARSATRCGRRGAGDRREREPGALRAERGVRRHGDRQAHRRPARRSVASSRHSSSPISRTVWVDVDVYQKDLAEVRVGQRRRICGGRRRSPTPRAPISYVAPDRRPGDAHARRARVVLPNADGAWRPGTVRHGARARPASGGRSPCRARALQTHRRRAGRVRREGDGFVPRPVDARPQRRDARSRSSRGSPPASASPTTNSFLRQGRARQRRRRARALSARHARAHPPLLDRAPLGRGRRDARARRVRRLALCAAADRRGARHHQQPGADQHRRSRALAGRGREAGHVPDRDGARRHPGPGVHALALAQRLLRRSRRSSSDDVDIYFARQQVERAARPRRATSLPAGAEPRMGPISTGLGEIYMWTVEFAHPRRARRDDRDGEPGWQPDGAYLTPEGERLPHDARARRLPAHGAGLDHPPAAEGRAGRRRRRRDRRLRQAVPRAARPA